MQDTVTATDKPHKRKSNASHVQPSLQFVNVSTQSESERRDSRKLIRSNATHFRWRQARKAHVRSDTVRTLPQQSRPAEADDVIVDREHAHYGALTASPPISVILPRVTKPWPATIGRPLSLVGIGHIDPFEAYPSQLPKQVVSPLLAQGR